MIRKLRTRLEQYHFQILIAALLIGAVLRWLQIGQRSFWYDETFSALTARLSLSQILSNAAIDIHPPGYYVLLHFWLGLGQTEAFIRSFSAIFSWAAIGLIFGLARWMFDKPTAALSALLMAILPFQVYFAQEARMYGLVIFLTIGLMWLFLYALTRPDAEANPSGLFNRPWLIWGGYALIAAFGLYVHYFVGLVLVALHLWFGLNWRRYRVVALRLLLADGLVILLFLPQLNQALTRTGYYLDVEAWQAAPNILSPLTAIYYLLFAHRAPIWVAPVGMFLTLAMLVLTAWESRRHPKSERHVEGMLWLVLLVPIITVVLVSWISTRSIYVERSFAVTSPALILLLARGAVAAPRWSPTPYLLLMLAVPVVVTLFVHFLTPDPAKPPLREAFQKVEAEFAIGDISLHLQDASAIPALWYSDKPQLLVDTPGAAFIFASTHRLFGGDITVWQPALAGADRLWLTVMPRFAGPEQKAVLDAIEATYPRLNGWDWGSVQLYLFDLRDTKP